MVRRVTKLFTRAALVLALAGGAVNEIHAATPSPVQIDVLLGLTGGGAFAGAANQSTLQALETYTNQHGGISGRPVHFAILDNKTDPTVAVQLANELIANKSKVILVSGFVAACKAVASLVSAGPVEYCLSPALYPQKGSFVFSAGVSTRDTIEACVRYFHERGWNHIGTITSNDASGLDADAQIDAALAQPENKALQIVDREHFAPGDLSVAAQMSKIRAAHPDVLIAWTSGTPFGTILRAVQDSGTTIPIMTTNGNMIYHQMKQYASIMPKDLYFPGPGYIVGQAATAKERALQRVYVNAIHQIGGTPDYESGEGWDPALLVIDALRHLGPDATADQIRQYLLSLHSATGISGIYDFDSGNQRGLGTKDVVVMRWEAAKDWWVAASRPGGVPISDKGTIR
jgi:branched-chain amino acid transport system substrate-binding protein